MTPECYPISTLPGTTPLFRAFCEVGERPELIRQWYPASPFAMDWAQSSLALGQAHRDRLADLLAAQGREFGAGERTLANVEKLRAGAAAVVTGQQVGLFGGPLLTLLKAATAIRKAKDATEATGREHVPVFWVASEDHDLAEVDQVALLTKTEVETLRLGLSVDRPVPVGGLPVDGAGSLEATLDRACELFGWGPFADVLREAYTNEPGTLASSFARLLTGVFAEYGLVVMDAASGEFHALGAPALRYALEHAEELETALLARSKELEAAGFHAQVLVAAGHSLLFLLDADTGARLPLRRNADGWKAGQQTYGTAELLAILEIAPERLSPNALLRPVFQDTILPTAAYVGGPAEVAYFAQSAVVYEAVLGRVTPVLPRLSATLLEPAIAALMAQHEVSVAQVWEAKTVEALALRLGARAMPIEGKRKLAAAGNAMDSELTALTEYLGKLSEDLGRAAGVSASKMRYQMDRLRRMAAQFETQKEASLTKHARAMVLSLYPEGHLQERLLGGAWFLGRDTGNLLQVMVDHAGLECPGHRVLSL